jgi:hypothetical protein
VLEAALTSATNENPEEQSHMTNEKVIMLIEAKIQPQRHTELQGHDLEIAVEARHGSIKKSAE